MKKFGILENNKYYLSSSSQIIQKFERVVIYLRGN